ncbi:tumor necrosis factor receptor superfamily member 14 [Channa argus]|uniref:tumor necrosis factor receptor superfamily member 14 n=1 Tax=Channa argus TaxID=215402 RepID=UPI00351FA807
MGLVQYFVITLMLFAQLVVTSPVAYTVNGEKCGLCPAGQYQKHGTSCAPCPPGSYTTELNCERECHRCFGDCRPDYNLRVEQNCTTTSNTLCVCQTGFTCSEWDRYTDARICKYCVKKKETVLTVVTPRSGKQTPSSTSSGDGSTSTTLCPFTKCGGRQVSTTPSNTDASRSPLAAILGPVVVVGCLALVILFCIRRPGDETCFKRAIVKLYNEGGHDVSHKRKESTHQIPRDSFSAKQHPSCPSAANLGPVHVHNPGTVIFSLLSQFTGQVGPTCEDRKTAERVSSEEEDERDCPVFHPTSSPSVHLSEEERSGDIDSIFFPSQEQGKDCHISKEEEL